MRESSAEVSMQMQPAAPAASMVEVSSSSDSPCESVAVCLERRSVRFRQARIDLLLVPGGRLRRYVVLESARLRMALAQPERREIDSLYARQRHFELRTSELWALAEHQAAASLRLLYSRVAEKELVEAQATPKRQRLSKPPGQVLPSLPADGSVEGELLYAGPTDGEMFCIELLEDRRRVRSIAHLDLARALQAAKVEVGHTIRIERVGHHEVSIREERTGSHGEGKRTLRHGRQIFRITKVTPLESDSEGASSNRSLRSGSSAS